MSATGPNECPNACWSCEGGIAQAHAPTHVVTGDMLAETTLAQEGLAHIQVLYRIEKELRGQTASGMPRGKSTQNPMDTFELWLSQCRARISAKSPTGEALKYSAKDWDGLILFLDDGRIERDSNTVERTIRPIALTRKNAFFAELIPRAGRGLTAPRPFITNIGPEPRGFDCGSSDLG